ncbi:MAG TPA: SgcJ/EcaC family oxidoreductase [Salegentibacter sp.]|nr:SgcJ/EcaC family oxidoreductase [Salegentibacter sp.]
MKNAISLSLLIFLISLSSQSQTDPGQVEEKIHEKTQMMVQKLNAGDPMGFASYFAEDASMKITGAEPISGREGIAKAHEPMTENAMELELKSEEFFHHGDYATEMGSYKIFTADGQEADYGNFMTLWKNVDGDWQIFRDVISSSSGE